MPQDPTPDPATQETIDVINRYNEVFAQGDVDGIMAAMTDDCVFEGTGPAPDGGRFEGQEEVRKVWEGFFSSPGTASFETEDIFAAGAKATVRWVYRWVDVDGKPGHIRGVDIFTVRDGKVAAKMAYVKG